MVLDNFHGGFLKVRGSQRYSRWPGRTYRTEISKTRRAKAPCSKENFSAARKTPAQSRSPKQTSRSRKLDFRWDSRCTGGGTLLAQNKHTMQGLGPPPHHSAAPKSKSRVNRSARPIASLDLPPQTNFARREVGARTYGPKSLDPPLPKPPKQKLLIIAKKNWCQYAQKVGSTTKV